MGFLQPKKPKPQTPTPKPTEVTVDDEMADPEAVDRANERIRANEKRVNKNKLRIPLGGTSRAPGSGLQIS